MQMVVRSNENSSFGRTQMLEYLPFDILSIEERLVAKIELAISVALQLALLWVVISALFHNRWEVAFTASCVLLLTFLPSLLEQTFDVFLPTEFTFVTCLFLYSAYALGELSQFYDKFWWWDLMLHSFSALVMGLSGFLMVYVFYLTNRIHIRPVYVAFLSFSFAVTVGVVWEVFEFIMDQVFALNMQKSGLVDTMSDLIVDILGALVAGFIGYKYVKDGDSLIASQLISLFVKRNPHIFEKEEKFHNTPE